MYSYGYPYQQQPMTDIGQANSEKEALDSYVQAGRSKIILTSDDKTIVVKSVSMNGQVATDIFDRRPPAAAPAAPDYVTREEFITAIEALKSPKKAVKTEAAE